LPVGIDRHALRLDAYDVRGDCFSRTQVEATAVPSSLDVVAKPKKWRLKSRADGQ